ncbi:hypothetical protein ACGFYV_12435 [Streptomyces sp. NPDC048297]|uniref:hypothetical protein n=1 Tax=Streptomyces sp. NPDC048297 TaxID=3365531 RepID=UPI003724B9EE
MNSSPPRPARRRSESRWDLDTAYLAQEARAGDEPAPQRIDALPADRPRVLPRGEAGVGTTTPACRLAAHATHATHAGNGTLGPRLRRLSHLAPFVVLPRAVHAPGDGLPAVCPTSSPPAAPPRARPDRFTPPRPDARPRREELADRLTVLCGEADGAARGPRRTS